MLKLQRVGFIEEKETLEIYLNKLFPMVSDYHKEIGSGEFDFATEVFIQGWKEDSIIVFDLKDKEDVVGFAFVFIGVNLLLNKTTYQLSHIYMKPEYRGDMELLKDLLKQIMESKNELGFDLGVLNVSPELMPLAMSLTDAGLLYSVLGFN